MIVMLILTGGADFLGWSEGPPIRSLNFSDGDVDVDVDVDGDGDVDVVVNVDVKVDVVDVDVDLLQNDIEK